MLTRNARWPGPKHGQRIQPMKELSRGEQLLEDMERFHHQQRISLTQICARAGVSDSLVYRLRNGFNPRSDVENRVRTYMRRHAAEAETNP